ncbi:MAG: histidine--tRNA ligase [Planctomycetota bacterium]|nr:histidine--tRNA ligase [Planctomycetota bacterium]
MSAADHDKSPAGRGEARAIQRPTGTRDFYPDDQARRRYVFDTWRRVGLRHGFDEIDGPTFEHLDLYTVKSGEGIVSELFSFRRFGGEKEFALRPEFTPTLARMAAAKAAALPKPVKWFSVANYFRAERPQRGRLREFAQWNVDVLGDDSAQADAECIACCVEALRAFGLTEKDVRVRVSHRGVVTECLAAAGVREESMEAALALLDRRQKVDGAEFAKQAQGVGLDVAKFDAATAARAGGGGAGDAFGSLLALLDAQGVRGWCDAGFGIVRGLAYYTGTVFEVHEAGGKERAIAGGGRYDKLIELFGGPPTPAVGFAMGDVVLSLVLEDRGLMPTGAALLEKIGARPDAFVISNGAAASDAALTPLVARLRGHGLHARHTYRSTKNVGKLLKEAAQTGARCAVIIEDGASATVKDLDSGETREGVALESLPALLAETG